MDFTAKLFSLVFSLISAAGKTFVHEKAEEGIAWIKIRNKLESSLLAVNDSLGDFLRDEKLTDTQRELLVYECEAKLKPLIAEPGALFAASLDGSKLFTQLHPDGRLPVAIQDEQLGHFYRLLFERVATLVCTYAPALRHWQTESQVEVFRRFDQICEGFTNMSRKVDAFLDAPREKSDELLARLRRARLQTVELQIELTSLAGERPEKGKLDDVFVVPSLSMQTSKEARRVGTRDELQQLFTNSYQRAVVSGAPGSGKSTLAFWLERLSLASFDAPFALLIPLRALAKSDPLPSDLDLLLENIDLLDRPSVDNSALQDWKGRGKITFILDGFDEIPPGRRDSVLKWIVGLDTRFAAGNLVVTSRPLTTDHLSQLPPEWKRWEIEPFDAPRVIEYIERWYTSAPLLSEGDRSIDARSLALTWTADPVLNHLTGNPLMLSTLLMVHYMEGHTLPKGRTELYKRYIDGMLGLWDDRRKIPAGTVTLKRDDKRKILTRIALYLHLRNLDQLGEEDVIPLVASILTDEDVLCIEHTAEEVLSHLRERTGLLIGPGTYSFVHKSVGEFLVAETVFQGTLKDSDGGRIDRFRLFEERHNDRWNTTLFFWAGLASMREVEEFIEKCLDIGESKDAPLAIGLMYDRMRHLSREFLSRQLDRAVRIAPPEAGKGHYDFLAEPKGFTWSLRCSTPELRSIGGIGFWGAIREFVDHGLGFICLEHANDLMRTGTWITFTGQARSMDEWQQLMTNESVTRLLPEQWPLIGFRSSMYRCVSDKQTDFTEETIFRYFNKHHPDSVPVLPFVIMGLLIPVSGIDHLEPGPYNRAISILLKHRTELHDPRCLAGTQHSVHRFLGSPKRPLICSENVSMQSNPD